MLDDTTILMWVFTIILICGLIVILTPIIATAFFDKDINFGIWSIGTKSSITIHKTSAKIGATMIVVGLLGSIIVGVGTDKGRETFTKMYSIY